tara:strand:+ start:1408 stop:1554 length:147 start_codon:yes stop_codon:yes gene_type:complete
MAGKEPNREDAPYRPWGPSHPDHPDHGKEKKIVRKNKFKHDPRTSVNA